MPAATFSRTESPSGVGTSMVAPDGGLDEQHRDVDDQVVAAPGEDRRTASTGRLHEEVAGRAALDAGLALAVEPDALAVLDARPGS